MCFKLAIADRPIFLEDDNVSPLQGAVFEVPAGREFTFTLTAAAANDATGVVVISILSDPGAPLGAKLGPPAKVLCYQVAAVCELFPLFSSMRIMRTWGGIVDTCHDASPII